MKILYDTQENLLQEIVKTSSLNPSQRFGVRLGENDYIFLPDKDGCRVNICNNELVPNGNTVIPNHCYRVGYNVVNIIEQPNLRAVITEAENTNIKIKMGRSYNSEHIADIILRHTDVPMTVNCIDISFNTVIITHKNSLYTLTLKEEVSLERKDLKELIVEIGKIVEWDKKVVINIFKELFMGKVND